MARIQVAVAAAVAGALAGCGPHQANPVRSAAYRQAITVMAAHCTQDPAQLRAMTRQVHRLEVRAGAGESLTHLAGRLAATVSWQPGRRSCVDPFAAYLAEREGRCVAPSGLPAVLKHGAEHAGRPSRHGGC